jgi:hypothetical protein
MVEEVEVELMVVVRMKLMVEERDAGVVLVRALLGEEGMTVAELTTIVLLELDFELEAIVLEEEVDAEVVVERLLEMLDTKIGSEYIDDTGVVSWPGPMMLVGFETTGEAELKLEVKTGSGELELDDPLLEFRDAELRMALDLVLLDA